MKEKIRQFNLYVKQFDLKEKALIEKFHHTFRVMEYSKIIATSIEMNEEDIQLACTIGLLHDIGRFHQWTDYHTFHDKDSVNHSDLGVEILKKNHLISQFVTDEKTQNLVLKAISNHGKREVEPMNERELLFTKIIRDADKLDILMELYNQITTEKPILNQKLVDSILKQELCNDIDLSPTDEDQLLRSLAFLFDIHFVETITFLHKKKVIENKLNLLEIYFPNNILVEQIKQTINTYMKERMKNNVR